MAIFHSFNNLDPKIMDSTNKTSIMGGSLEDMGQLMMIFSPCFYWGFAKILWDYLSEAKKTNVVKPIINYPFGNGKHTTYKNGDDWGMVYYCFNHINLK